VNAGAAVVVHTFVAGLTELTIGVPVSMLTALETDTPELPERSVQFTFQLLLPWLNEELEVMIVLVLLMTELFVPRGTPATNKVQDAVALEASV